METFQSIDAWFGQLIAQSAYSDWQMLTRAGGTLNQFLQSEPALATDTFFLAQGADQIISRLEGGQLHEEQMEYHIFVRSAHQPVYAVRCALFDAAAVGGSFTVVGLPTRVFTVAPVRSEFLSGDWFPDTCKLSFAVTVTFQS